MPPFRRGHVNRSNGGGSGANFATALMEARGLWTRLSLTGSWRSIYFPSFYFFIFSFFSLHHGICLYSVVNLAYNMLLLLPLLFIHLPFYFFNSNFIFGLAEQQRRTIIDLEGHARTGRAGAKGVGIRTHHYHQSQQRKGGNKYSF
jgi:hypothetical protein